MHGLTARAAGVLDQKDAIATLDPVIDGGRDASFGPAAADDQPVYPDGQSPGSGRMR